MSIGTRASKKIVFAGGGHACLYSLLRAKELVRRGFEVTLVDASPHLYYSGMATSAISGAYGPDEHRMDVRRLVEQGGGAFVEGRVEEILAADREFVLERWRHAPLRCRLRLPRQRGVQKRLGTGRSGCHPCQTRRAHR